MYGPDLKTKEKKQSNSTCFKVFDEFSTKTQQSKEFRYLGKKRKRVPLAFLISIATLWSAYATWC